MEYRRSGALCIVEEIEPGIVMKRPRALGEVRYNGFVLASHVTGDMTLRYGTNSQRIQREANFLAEVSQLEGVRVPKLVENGGKYLLLGKVDGETLKELVLKKPISDATLCIYMTQIGQMLGTMHKNDFTHTDPWADNIMITPEQDAVLLDSGLLPSKKLDKSKANARDIGVVLASLTAEMLLSAPKAVEPLLNGYEQKNANASAIAEQLLDNGTKTFVYPNVIRFSRDAFDLPNMYLAKTIKGVYGTRVLPTVQEWAR